MSSDPSSARGAAFRRCLTRCSGFPATPLSEPWVSSLEGFSSGSSAGAIHAVDGRKEGGADDDPSQCGAPADVAGRADDAPWKAPRRVLLICSSRSRSSSGSSGNCSGSRSGPASVLASAERLSAAFFPGDSSEKSMLATN